jgi:hypothetical protein
MTTRRDALKMTAGAGLAALGMKALPATVTAAPDPDEIDKYRMMCAAMVVEVLRSGDEDDEKAADVIMQHVLFGRPVPVEYEWARAQCREALLLVLQGLDA